MKLLFVFALIPLLSLAQTRKQKKAIEAQQKADKVVISNLKNHTTILNSSSANQLDNKAILEYVAAQFKNVGLQAKGSNGYYQTFTVDNGKVIDNKTSLKINEAKLQVNKDFFPLPYSASKAVSGMPSMALRERGVPWFKDVKEWLNENVITGDFTIDKAIQKEAAKVAAKGATALFIYNSGNIADGLSFNKADKTPSLSIPVIYIMPEGFKKYFSDDSQMLDIELNVAIKESTGTSNNLIGYLDNGAPTSAIVSSVINTSDTAFSKSAINNAATLIEVARIVAATKPKNNNYVFMLLSQENTEEVGAKYWFNNLTVSTPVNYWVNVNSVAHTSSTSKLLLNGTETSSTWSELVSSVASPDLPLTTDKSQMINAKSSVFYQKKIPALSLSFASADASAASTNEDDFTTELQVAKFISKLVETADTKGKIAFSTPSDISSAVTTAKTTAIEPVATAKAITSVPPNKASVSLGVIPDKSSDGSGLVIAGVSPKKLAEKIGLQKGDLLTELGNFKITNLQSYIVALSNFKAGDKVILKIKRGKEDKEFAVEF